MPECARMERFLQCAATPYGTRVGAMTETEAGKIIFDALRGIIERKHIREGKLPADAMSARDKKTALHAKTQEQCLDYAARTLQRFFRYVKKLRAAVLEEPNIDLDCLEQMNARLEAKIRDHEDENVALRQMLQDLRTHNQLLHSELQRLRANRVNASRMHAKILAKDRLRYKRPLVGDRIGRKRHLPSYLTISDELQTQAAVRSHYD